MPLRITGDCWDSITKGIEKNAVRHEATACGVRHPDYRGQWKTKRIPGVEFLGHFLQHLLPRGMQHIRRYEWMARHVHNEKLQWLREHFHVGDPPDATSPEAAHGDAEPADEVASRPCRCCPGTMVLTARTDRPRVSDILRMPLRWFQEARAGALVTLGPRVAPAPSRSVPPTVPPRVPSGVPSGVLSTSAVTPGEARGP